MKAEPFQKQYVQSKNEKQKYDDKYVTLKMVTLVLAYYLHEVIHVCLKAYSTFWHFLV